MKSPKNLFLYLTFICLLILTGCRDAKEGADVLADEVTGKNKIEKKIELEDKLKKATDEHNKKQQEALDSIDK